MSARPRPTGRRCRRTVGDERPRPDADSRRSAHRRRRAAHRCRRRRLGRRGRRRLGVGRERARRHGVPRRSRDRARAGDHPVGNGPRSIAPAPGGVWVTEQFGGSVARIDARHDRVADRVRVGNRPTGLAAVDGTLWMGVRASDAAHRGGTLRIPATYDPDSIDPAVAYVPLSQTILSTTNDGLTAYEKVGGSDGRQLVPDLAVSLPTAADDGRVYRFVIRRGIRYSTGRPCDRPTFERPSSGCSRSRARRATTSSPGSSAPALHQAPSSCDLSRGISTGPGPTVTFRLDRPTPTSSTSSRSGSPPCCPRARRRARPDAGRSRPPGPYMIARYRPKHELRLARNPQFREWSQAAQPDGFPDAIAFRFNVKGKTAVTDVERGRADDFAGPKDACRQPGGRTPHPIRRPDPRQRPQRGHRAVPQHACPTLRRCTCPPRAEPRGRSPRPGADRRRARGGRSHLSDPAPEFSRIRSVLPVRWIPLAEARRLVRASGTRGMRVNLWTVPTFLPMIRYAASVLEALGYRATVTLRRVFRAHLRPSGARPGRSDVLGRRLRRSLGLPGQEPELRGVQPRPRPQQQPERVLQPAHRLAHAPCRGAQATDPARANRLVGRRSTTSSSMRPRGCRSTTCAGSRCFRSGSATTSSTRRTAA